MEFMEPGKKGPKVATKNNGITDGFGKNQYLRILLGIMLEVSSFKHKLGIIERGFFVLFSFFKFSLWGKTIDLLV